MNPSYCFYPIFELLSNALRAKCARMSAESTSFIIDVSKSMLQEDSVSKVIAYLEYALLDKCKKLRKTDWISCYLANCQYTKNSQDVTGIYQIQSFLAPITTKETIKILGEIQKYSYNPKEGSSKREAPNEEIQSMIQSVLVASLDIRSQFNKRKLLRQIVVFTDDLNGLDLTANEIDVLQEEFSSRLILIDCSKNVSGEDIFNSKWGQLVRAIPGSKVFGINELLLDITSAKSSVVKPVRVFSGQLRLGADPVGLLKHEFDPFSDSKCMCIQVEGYPATKPVHSLNRKTVLETGEGDSINYEPVKSIIEYEINDKDRGENVSVSQDSIAKAFRYGSDYVVLPSTLEEERFYKTLPGLDLRGFLDREKLQRYYLNSESRFILADTKQGSAADATSFDALVDVLLEYDKIAIARFVSKPNAEVQMCVLCPLLVNASGEAVGSKQNSSPIKTLVLNRLPFAEDERVSEFPRLVERTTTSGVKIDQGKDTIQIDELVCQYVDSLDLDKQDYDIVPDREYYSMLNPVAKDTSLPLPDPDELPTNDPLRIPAVHIHRQQQVLLEYVHQKLINKSPEFQVPDLPDLLKNKITPHFRVKGSRSLEELVRLLAIKKLDKQRGRSDEQFESENDENIPSFEAIMARGAR